MTLFEEFRQRNVFKVAVAYLIVAWLLMQVASLILPQLALPDWAPTLVTVLLILGLPVALILAWAYELTPAGIKPARSADDGSDAPTKSGRLLNYLLVVLATIAVGIFVADRFMSQPEPAQVQRIAVLPFDNLSEDPDDVFFAAGLHEEVLNQLAKISGLAVISRSSVLQFADSRPSVPQIAEQLDVEVIVEASVRYAGDELLVTVQLIDGETDTHILSETYDANRSDVSEVFSVQASIATEIADQLGAEIAPTERSALDRVPTQSAVAYAHYLRSRELNSATRLADALAQLDLAIEADPNFAEAYADRAYLYSYGQIMSAAKTQLNAALDVDPGAYQDLAVQNANRALELFPELGQAWLARALNHAFHFRWRSARDAFERALRLSPNDVFVVREYAQFLSYTGDFADALELAERARALDPRGILTLVYVASIESLAGRIDAALATVQQVSTFDDGDPVNNLYIGLFSSDTSQKVAALRLAETGIFDANSFLLVAVANGYSQLGLDDDAARALDRYESWAQNEEVGAGGWAQYYAVRGDHALALEWLETAIERLESGLADPGYVGLQLLPIAASTPAMQSRLEALRARLDALKVN